MGEEFGVLVGVVPGGVPVAVPVAVGLVGELVAVLVGVVLGDIVGLEVVVAVAVVVGVTVDAAVTVNVAGTNVPRQIPGHGKVSETTTTWLPIVALGTVKLRSTLPFESATVPAGDTVVWSNVTKTPTPGCQPETCT